MNENVIPESNEASVITSFSQSCPPNDIIDLTDINDIDESEVTSNVSVIVSNNSVNSQQPARSKRSRKSNSADDSICILYEKIQPPPEVEVVNEVIIGNSSENVTVSNAPISPIIMGSYTENPGNEFRQLSSFPDIFSERTSSSSQLINFSFDTSRRAPYHSTLSSCKYATVQHKSPSPSLSLVAPHPVVALTRIPLLSTEVPLHLKTLPGNPPSQSSNLEKSNIEDKAPKIQCGICLDGHEEIAASDKHLMSTKCGHIFCDVCIKTSLKNVCKCPKCRKRVTAKEIHPLYL